MHTINGSEIDTAVITLNTEITNDLIKVPSVTILVYEARVNFFGTKYTLPAIATELSLNDMAVILIMGARHKTTQNTRITCMIVVDRLGLRAIVYSSEYAVIGIFSRQII